MFRFKMFSVFCFLVVVFSVNLIAGGFTQLPRNFGPFEIGMSIQAFKTLTKLQPEPCEICIHKEAFVSLSAQELKKFNDTNTEFDGADFFFYDNKLYHIALGPKEKNIFVNQQELEKQFGPGQTLKDENGLDIVKWEDNSTIISLKFRPEAEEVFSVNYYDWNTKEERDWRAALAAEALQNASN